MVFRKVDLHIHTPKSACYSDMSVTPEQIVDAALAVGLGAIAITDHNTVAAIDGLRRVAGEKGLLIYPGVELSTVGGHFIALFTLDTAVDQLEDFLDYIGLDREGWGDAITVATGDTEEVLQKIEEWGGLTIAAHVERWPSGFLETNQPRRVKVRIHGSDYLSALEITVPQNKGLWNAGKVRGYPRKRACIQGSDAHALDEVGRRPLYVEMNQVDLDSLQAALLVYETAVRFPEELAREEPSSI